MKLWWVKVSIKGINREKLQLLSIIKSKVEIS